MEDANKFTNSRDMFAHVQNEDQRKAFIDIKDGQVTKAANMVQSVLAYDLIMQSVVLKELTEELSGARLDVADLLCQASIICPDIMAEFTWEGSYMALDIMRKILYNIGPDTRSVKKGKDTDKNYRLHCNLEATDEKVNLLKKSNYALAANPQVTAADAKRINTELVTKYGGLMSGRNTVPKTFVGMFLISTFKNGRAPTRAPAVDDGVLLLTVKQATIIGLFILSKFTRLAREHGIDIFTPLAGAIFPRSSIDDMMRDAEIRRAFATPADLIDAINKSAQNGGQFLPGSRADIAAVCAIVGTEQITKDAERKNIVQRTTKQFLNQERPSSKALFSAICKFATSGLPSAWTYEQLHMDYERIKISLLAKAAGEATVHSISTPSTSGN